MRTQLLKKCFAAIGLLATLGMATAQMPQMPVQAAAASETKINVAITSADIKSGGEAELQAKIELGSGVASLQGIYAYITLNRALTDGESMDVKQPSGDMAFVYGFKDNNKKQFEVMGLEQYGTNVTSGEKKDTLFNITLSGLKSPVSMYFDFIGEHSYLKTGAKTITETMIVKQGDLTSSTGFISVDGKKAEDTNPDTTGDGQNYGKDDAGQLGAVTEDTTKKDTTDTTTDTTNKDTTNKDTTASTDTTNKDTTTSTDSSKTDINISTDAAKEDAASSTDSKTDSATTPTTGKDTTGSADSGKGGASGTSTDGTSLNANTVASSTDSAVKGNSVTTNKGDSTPKTRDTSNMIFGLVGLAAVVALIIIIVAAKAKTKSRDNR